MKYKLLYLLYMPVVLSFVSQCAYGISFITYAPQDIATNTLTFSISGNYAFYANQTYNFNPASTSTSVPMIKVTASNTLVNGNNIAVFNQDTTYSGWSAIEIGYTPAELAADDTLEQPFNVTIQNISLIDFDCGIIVHAGVQNVTIENCNILDVSVGIICAGLTTAITETIPNLTDPVIANVTLSNVLVNGHQQNYHVSLESLKTLIEATYGYGTDYFMPLASDPLDGNAVNAYSYMGVWLNNTYKADFEKVYVEKIGYAGFATASEGNGYRTQGLGIVILNSDRIIMNNLAGSDSDSEINVVGLQLDNLFDVQITNSEFSYHTGGYRAVGIDVTNMTDATYSVVGLIMDTVNSRANDGTTLAIGMNLSLVSGCEVTNLMCKFNAGGQQAYGIYSTGMHTVDITDSLLTENSATSTSNTVATNQGIVAAGFYGNNISDIELTNVDMDTMQALNSAYGLYLVNSSTVKLTSCQFINNVAVEMRSGEAAQIMSDQIANEISKLAPVVASTATGGYGAYMVNCKNVQFNKCVANSNAGHRAGGLAFIGGQAIQVLDTFTAAQYATGMMFNSTLYSDNAANPAAIAIEVANNPLLFCNLTKSTVNALTTTNLFLQAMSNIRASQIAGDDPAYDDMISVLSTAALLQATVARYRLWGTAIGIHAHNIIGFVVNGCSCLGQMSLFDSAMGICSSGRNLGHSVQNSTCSLNVGNASSVITVASSGAAYVYNYNLSGVQFFWEMLTASLSSPYPVAANNLSVGFYTTAPYFIAQGQQTYGDVGVGDDIYVCLNGTDQWPLISPIGPVGAGIVLGDYMLDALILNNNIFENYGNSGQACGVLIDEGYSITLQSNTIAGNIANIYGVSVGIMDLTGNSPNLYQNNFLECNKCSTFNNSNYFIPFDPSDPNTLAFPVVKMYNGNFVVPNTQFDNIEILYSQNSDFYSVEYLNSIPLHPDILSYWTTNSCWS